MIRIDRTRTPQDLVPRIDRLFALSADKIRGIERTWRPENGAPVFTVKGRYTARGWTEWTEGFQYRLRAAAVRRHRRARVPRARPRAHADADGAAPHARRRPRSRLQQRQHLRRAVAPGASKGASTRPSGSGGSTSWRSRSAAPCRRDAGRRCPDGGYIHSFNGAHSLFVDTIRSLRALALSHRSAIG